MSVDIFWRWRIKGVGRSVNPKQATKNRRTGGNGRREGPDWIRHTIRGRGMAMHEELSLFSLLSSSGLLLFSVQSVELLRPFS